MTALAARRDVSAAIEGVNVIPLARVPDERGTILHMLRHDDPHFIRFGEIYFSTVYRDVVKGWHRHREMTLNYACVFGRVKLAIYDDRPDSPTRGRLLEQFLGPDHYALVQIPPGVWNGFKGMTDPFALVANCCTHAHDPDAHRTERLDPFVNDIPYDWAVRCH
ncbi:MAG: dTDP-4-dehydrorhamnose 3,5-epimerase family protein [Planctomycetota bacterium]|jgi:dTDP-4-dehydrorhamnose 3,5-epimerase